MKTPEQRIRRRAVFMLLMATAFWGVSFPLMKGVAQLTLRVVPDAGTWFVTSMMIMPRFLLAVLVLAVVARRELLALTRSEFRQGWIIGGFAAGGMLLQADGLQYTAASTSAFLTQFYAITIPLYVAWRWRTNPGIVVWLCTGLVLVGVAVLGRFDWRALRLGRGELETLASSLFFMGQILALERKEFALNRVLPVTVVMFGLETIVFAAVSVASAPEWAAFGRLLALPSWWAFTIPMTVFCTIGAYVLMNTWQPRISSTEAGLIYCVEPIFSALISLFLPGLMSVWALISYPNEELTSHLLIGGGLITVANILLQLRPAPVGLKPASA